MSFTPQKPVRQKHIFGVQIDDVSLTDTIRAGLAHLSGAGRGAWVATVNAEILVHARRQPHYRDVLNSALLRVPDGSGPQYMARLRHRVTGVALTHALLGVAQQQKLAVLCVVRGDGRSTGQHTAEAIEKLYPGIRVHVIAVANREQLTNETIESIADAITAFDVRFVFCALGFPYQEQLLHDVAAVSTGHGWLGIGNGGTFDYMTGVQHAPPRIMRAIGLEWLWRLVTHPSRWRRIFTALVVFPVLYVRSSVRRAH